LRAALLQLRDTHIELAEFCAGRPLELPFDEHASALLAWTRQLTENALTLRLEDDRYYDAYTVVDEINRLLLAAKPVLTQIDGHSYRASKAPTHYLRPELDLSAAQFAALENTFLTAHTKCESLQLVCVYRSAREVHRGDWFAIRHLSFAGGFERPQLQFEELWHGDRNHSRSAGLLSALRATVGEGQYSNSTDYHWEHGNGTCFDHCGLYQFVLRFRLSEPAFLRDAYRRITSRILEVQDSTILGVVS
jgi:hypothetical protein